MLKYLFILICAATLAPELCAEQKYVIRRSLSEQFIVYGPKATPLRRFKSERVPLDSSLVAVSCERIKQALLGELEGTGRRQINFRNQDEGKIYAVLHPTANEPVIITPVPTSRFLNYRIDLPNEIEATRLIDAVTEAVLLEIVNRGASENFTQVPLWLVQGLSAQVQAVNPESLVLEEHLPITRIKVRTDPIAEIRRNNPNFSALTFDELSWPELLSAEKAARYRLSSHLFLAELLRLKDGPACLRRMLKEMPDHSRWQIAFMRAFEPHFQKLVDVEKWWDLTFVELTSAGKTLPHEQSVEQLEAALRSTVRVVQDFGAGPKRNTLALQEIISGVEPRQQSPAIEKVIGQLRVLRSRVHPEIAPLVEEYRVVLENYLQNGDKNFLGRVFSRGSLEDLRQSTRQRLDALDKRLTQLREQAKPVPSTREEAILSALEIAAPHKR